MSLTEDVEEAISDEDQKFKSSFNRFERFFWQICFRFEFILFSLR